MRAVAAGHELALELLLGALVDEPHPRTLALEVVERDVLDLEQEAIGAFARD